MQDTSVAENDEGTTKCYKERCAQNPRHEERMDWAIVRHLLIHIVSYIGELIARLRLSGGDGQVGIGIPFGQLRVIMVARTQNGIFGKIFGVKKSFDLSLF